MDRPQPKDPANGGVGARRAKIEQLLAIDPSDVFLRYALALELVNDGEVDGGLAILTALSKAPTRYIPAFHMAGRHLATAGRFDEARGMLREGIELAREKGESHAAAEMAELLVSLGDVGEQV